MMDVVVQNIPTIENLSDMLIARGADPRALERGRRVAGESGQRLDTVLLQLGLVTERGLAEAYARLRALPLAGADRYGFDAPLLPERLGSRFLRQAKALPVALLENRLLVAVADPL